MASQLSLSLKNLPVRDGNAAGLPSPSTPSTPGNMRGLNPLTSKLTTVLSTSYADAEFRDALNLLDERGLQNTAETRRRLRLDLQKEVIDGNGEVIADFGRVAEVGDYA
jgi:conserved oligomeric Golgi complex subunit 6